MRKAPPKLGKTVLPKDVINTHARHWEAHLQSIADFLVPVEGVWWREIEDEDCIEFFDGPEEIEFWEQGPSLHHFHFSNIRREKNFPSTLLGRMYSKRNQNPSYQNSPWRKLWWRRMHATEYASSRSVIQEWQWMWQGSWGYNSINWWRRKVKT